MSEPISRSEHVSVFGMTGGGKSFYAENYLPHLAPVLKLDTKGEAVKKFVKGENIMPTVPIHQQALILSFEDLQKWDHVKHPYGIYVPGGLWMLPSRLRMDIGLRDASEDDDETDDPTLFNRIFRWHWDKFRFQTRGSRLWIDELKDFFESHSKIDKYLKYHYTKGRFFDIGVWGLSQEPRWLHSLTMSQATHVVSFDLARIEDRRRVADNTGAPEFMTMPTGYNFWYFRRGWKNAVKGIIQ